MPSEPPQIPVLIRRQLTESYISPQDLIQEQRLRPETSTTQSVVRTPSICNDRSRLTSQRHRFELPELLNPPHGSSLSTALVAQKPCPVCGQSDANLQAINGTVNICNACHRFVGVQNAALWLGPPSLPAAAFPAPLQSLKCYTCLPLPIYYLDEFLLFFSACFKCGQIPEETLTHIVAYEGDVLGSMHHKSARVTRPSSKQFQDWCYYLSRHARMDRLLGPTTPSIARKIAFSESLHGSRSLKRSLSVVSKRVVTRKPLCSVVALDGGAAARHHSGLIPIENGGREVMYHRRFSFDSIKKEELDQGAQQQHQHHDGGNVSTSSDMPATCALNSASTALAPRDSIPNVFVRAPATTFEDMGF